MAYSIDMLLAILELDMFKGLTSLNDELDAEAVKEQRNSEDNTSYTDVSIWK